MYEEINRFLGLPEHADTWDRLFGTAQWRAIVPVREAAERRRRIHDLYQQQLRQDAGARHVRSFEMRNQKNATDYFLFFATNSTTGLVKMKEAMWRVDRSGAFVFSDATISDQLVLFEPQPNFSLLRDQIVGHFGGAVVSVEEIERFVSEQTAFTPSQFKRPILDVMEREQPPALEIVYARPGRRRGTFPPGTRVRFLSR